MQTREGGSTASYDASVTVFCQNEAATIGACVASIAGAAEGYRIHLTVIVNGSSDDSAALALQAARQASLLARVYTIAFGDKANAINQALAILPPARLHVFVDGYAVVAKQTLTGFFRVLEANPRAVAATGVAGNGRTMARATAETLQQGGRLHGQLHALTPDFVARMQQAGLRLPVGLYRGDGLLGSMASHDLDALGKLWNGHLVAGAAEAVYMIPALSPWRRADWQRQFRRKVRQMRGRLENAAIKSLIYREGYAGLPGFADDMIAAWLEEGGRPQAGVADRPFMALALRQHRRFVRPDAGLLAPRLFGEVGLEKDVGRAG